MDNHPSNVYCVVARSCAIFSGTHNDKSRAFDGLEAEVLLFKESMFLSNIAAADQSATLSRPSSPRAATQTTAHPQQASSSGNAAGVSNSVPAAREVTADFKAALAQMTSYNEKWLQSEEYQQVQKMEMPVELDDSDDEVEDVNGRSSLDIIE